MQRVAVTFAQTRANVEWGMQAKLTPLRFANGTLTQVRGASRYTVQRLMHGGQEVLYILTFYLPRFLNLSYNEKLVTVFHELYHVSPKFDGDIRRFDGPYYMHTASQVKYDQLMAKFVRQYLRMRPPADLRAFLKVDFTALKNRFGPVVGLRVPVPRLIRLGDVA